MESGAPSLSFEHVAMALGGRPILRDVDFRLERGEMVVIFAMGWIGGSVPAANFIGLLLGGIAAP